MSDCLTSGDNKHRWLYSNNKTSSSKYLCAKTQITASTRASVAKQPCCSSPLQWQCCHAEEVISIVDFSNVFIKYSTGWIMLPLKSRPKQWAHQHEALRNISVTIPIYFKSLTKQHYKTWVGYSFSNERISSQMRGFPTFQMFALLKMLSAKHRLSNPIITPIISLLLLKKGPNYD